MTFQLTEQQRQMVHEQEGRPVEVVDPETQRAYVLITREQFDKVRVMLDESQAIPDVPSSLSLEIPPGIRRSQEAYWRELPELLKTRRFRGQWVCYYGNERIGIARND